eukprot:8834094-Alexandrium_andersonii.AAC.1
MSASLVGSEMCIRDSPADLDLLWWAVRRGSGSMWVPASPRTAVRGFPVSYTHLTLPTICSV